MSVPETPHESAAAKFAYRLRKLRNERGMSAQQVGAACYISRESITAIETLRLPPRLDTAQRLDKLFDLTEIAYFEDCYHDISREVERSPFRKYTDLESLARAIRAYHPLHIDGLFQTESYARYLISSYEPPGKIEEYVAVRMSRQDVLTRESPPHVVSVFRESVLREVVGGPQVMKEQLAQLLELSELLNVVINVVPTGRAVFPRGMFVLLTYDEEADLGYVETEVGGHIIEPTDQVNWLSIQFGRISGNALPVGESRELIRTIMEGL
ncbi:helix-turn-helix domain-containing protein [Actinomadura rugatobispora]|uniref:Scr1 family TA system antitoxin-like transcriptional regulator n=1 Tax=Actinomadura rugatobispora TaxID=1994 RepID=A0ABW1A622_9ACTN|nr:helix-turn-helix transcriptional regulator [Actinomadura rugatobispora]